MNQVTIHIGAGKCGSSSIQATLSRFPTFVGQNGKTFNYTAIRKSGEVQWGDDTRPLKNRPYRKSVSLNVLNNLPIEVIRLLRDKLTQIENPILSNEEMFTAPKGTRECLGKIGLPVKVIAYVRPQIEWINSAWWQWGAWSDLPRDVWIEQRIERSHWSSSLSRWAAIDEVEEVVVRLLPSDVVADFFAYFGCTTREPKLALKLNSSLPAIVLRLLQRRPELMKTYHHQIDFQLPNMISGLQLQRAPWVINQDLADKIIRQVTPSNQLLFGMLSSSDERTMRADQRWWNAAAYADRTVEPFEPSSPQEPELDELAGRLIELLFSSGSKKRAEQSLSAASGV